MPHPHLWQRAPGRVEKFFLDVDRSWTAVESDEAHEEVLEKFAFLANEVEHHEKWTKRTLRHIIHENIDLFGANRGWPGIRGWPGYGGPSADGLVSLTKMKTFWVIKYLNIYSINK